MKNNILKNIYLILAVLVPLQLYFKVLNSIHITVASFLFIVLFVYSIPDIFSNRVPLFLLKNKWYFAYLALCVLFTLRLISGGDLRNGLKITYFMWLGPVVFFTVKDLDRSIKNKLLLLLVLCSLPIMLISIVQAFSESLKMIILNSPLMKLFIEPDTLREIIEGTRRNNILMPGRGGGFFVNVNMAGLYFNLIICALIYKIFSAGKISGFDIILLVFSITGILSTGSTAAIFVSFIIFLTAIVFMLLKKIKILFRFNKISLLLIIIYLFLINLPILNINNVRCSIAHNLLYNKYKYFKSKIVHDLTLGRSDIWKISLGVLTENFLFGYGYSCEKWDIAYKKRYVKVHKSKRSYKSRYIKAFPAHNVFLEIWRYVGFPGVILFSCFIIFFFLDIVKKLFIGFSSEYFLGFLLISVLFLHGLTENLVFANVRIDMLFWLLMGIAENKA